MEGSLWRFQPPRWSGQDRWQKLKAILTEDALYFYDESHPDIACDQLKLLDILHKGIFRSDSPHPVGLKSACEPGAWARRVNEFFSRTTGQVVSCHHSSALVDLRTTDPPTCLLLLLLARYLTKRRTEITRDAVSIRGRRRRNAAAGPIDVAKFIREV